MLGSSFFFQMMQLSFVNAFINILRSALISNKRNTDGHNINKSSLGFLIFKCKEVQRRKGLRTTQLVHPSADAQLPNLKSPPSAPLAHSFWVVFLLLTAMTGRKFCWVTIPVGLITSEELWEAGTPISLFWTPYFYHLLFWGSSSIIEVTCAAF